MKLTKVKEVLAAEVLCCSDKLEEEVHSACGADLMSDVLASTSNHALLLTGLINLQVIRTAEMSDVSGIVFVRGKKPNREVIELAEEQGLLLMITQHTMYEACGLLYMEGLNRCHTVEGEYL